LDQFQKAPRNIKEQLAEELISYLNKKRRKRWDEAVTSIYFTHQSRKAWSFFNRLTERISQPKARSTLGVQNFFLSHTSVVKRPH